MLNNMKQYKNWIQLFSVLSLLFLFQSCNTVVEKQHMPSFTQGGQWAMSPLMNLTEIPHAGKRVSSILNTHLNSKGLNKVVSIQHKISNKDSLSLHSQQNDFHKKSLDWAKNNNIQYLITGTVDEWRYKYGLHGEPTVGISLKIIDINESKVLWSSSGAKTGRGNQNLSGITNQLLATMMEDFPHF